MANFLVDKIVSRFAKVSNSTQESLRGTGNQSLAVAQVEPEWCERSRAGQMFYGGCGVIANGIAPVQAIPTTTATLALFNNEADGGRSLLIEELNFFLGSGTPDAGATLLAGVSLAPITAPSAASNYATVSASSGGKASRAIWATAVTLATGTKWRAIGSYPQLAAATPGQGAGPFSVRGLIVPPRYAVGFAILSGTGTTPLFSITAAWSELVLDLE